LEENELIVLLQQGNASAFRLLVDKYKDRVYNTCLGLLSFPEEAEDISQEVFIEVYQSIKNFRGESTISTWLYRIAVNRSLDQIRKKKRKKRFAFITSIFDPNTEKEVYSQSLPAHPGVILENKERAETLAKAVDLLPEKQRIAFTLHKLEGMPYQEIAEILDTTLSSVESLIHRAKVNLKKSLDGYYKNNK
jgi:RNA polymerase sigma factor (sigma-70 family)